MMVGLAQASPCPDGELLRDAEPLAFGVADAERLTDGVVAGEGDRWDARTASVFASPGASVMWVFSTPRRIGALSLQADDNDTYVVESSEDGLQWETVWSSPLGRGTGLRSRHTDDLEVVTKVLRIRPDRGDGAFSVSEVGAWCEKPEPWPPERKVDNDRRDDGLPREERLAWLKLLATAFGMAGVWALWGMREGARWKRVLLSWTLIVASAWVWTNGGTFHGSRFVHLHEQFHYVLGSKYFPELGYTGLYACATHAEIEDGGDLASISERRVRDLRTNKLVFGRQYVAPPPCRAAFTPKRWQEFQRDTAYFRTRMGVKGWNKALSDHGYNASPTWTSIWRMRTAVAPMSDVRLQRNGVADGWLYLLVFACLSWGFGAEVAALAAVIWAVGYPWSYMWTGGGLGRVSWLAAAVLGLAALGRRRHALGGAWLAVSATLRVFPAVLGLGLLAWGLVGWRQGRAFPRGFGRALAGAGVAGLLCVGLPMWSAGSSVWVEFAANTRVHATTPVTNHMGMPTVIASSPSTVARTLRDGRRVDPFVFWKQARQEARRARWPVSLVVGFGVLIWLVRRARARPEKAWSFVALMVLPALTLLELASYYWVLFLLLAPLARDRGTAVGLCAIAGSTHVVVLLTDWYDEQHILASLLLWSGAIWGVNRFSTSAQESSLGADKS